jgi:hypothetical protein
MSNAAFRASLLCNALLAALAVGLITFILLRTDDTTSVSQALMESGGAFGTSLALVIGVMAALAAFNRRG